MARTKKSKVALITGGSKGIGFRIAQILAKKKYNIAICSRSLKEVKKAAYEIKKHRVKCLAFKVDVSDYKQCQSCVRQVIKSFSRIDILVNNAGIQGPIGNLWKNDVSKWCKTIHINLLGIFHMCHLVIPYMLKQRSGRIINLSGGGAAYGRPLFSAYAASKTAVVRLTETLAGELKNAGITVIAVAPGATWTNMTKDIFKKRKNLDRKTLCELKQIKSSGGTSMEKLEGIINYLISKQSKRFSGRLIHVNELGKVKRLFSEIRVESGLLRRVDYS